MCYSGTCYFEISNGDCSLYSEQQLKIRNKYGVSACLLGDFMGCQGCNEQSPDYDKEQHLCIQKLFDRYLRDEKEFTNTKMKLNSVEKLKQRLAEERFRDETQNERKD